MMFDRIDQIPLWLKLLAFSVLLGSAEALSNFMSPSGGGYVSFWLPAGLYVAVLLQAPTQKWPLYVGVAMVTDAIFDICHHTPLTSVLTFSILDSVEAVAGAWLYRRFIAERPAMSTLREFGALIVFSGILVPAVGGLIGAQFQPAEPGEYALLHSWASWIFGRLLAVMVLSPALLCFSADSPHRSTDRQWALRFIEVVVLATGLTASAYYIFALDQGINAPYKTRIIFFVLWAAIRFGVRGAALSTVWLSAISAYLTVTLRVGLSPTQQLDGGYVLTLHSFLASASLFGMVPAIALSERDRNLFELKASEARFRKLTEATTEGVVLSKNGKIYDHNDQIAKMFGYLPKQGLDRTILEFFAPNLRSAALQYLQSDSDIFYESECMRQDGSVFPVEVTVKVAKVGADTFRMAAVRDVESQKRSERALLHFAELVGSSDDAIIGKSLDGRITSWNPAAETIFGYTSEEAIGQRLTALYPEDRQHEEEELLRSIAAGHRIRHFETVRIRKDGSRVQISATISPIVDRTGQVIGASKVARDITDQKAVERDLRLFRTLIDEANDGIEVLDADTCCFLDMNEGWLANLGYNREEIIGMPLSAVKVAHRESDFQAAVCQLAAGEVVQAPTQRLRKDGSTFPAEVTVRMVVLDRRYLVCVVRDMTEARRREVERIEMESQLRRSQKMETVGRFAAGIAHDFNNILGAIFGCASLLKEDTLGNPEAQESTDEIIKAASRAKALVSQILTFSSLQEPNKEIIVLDEIIHEVLRLTRPGLSPSIELVLEGDAHRLAALADSGQILRVLMNLAQNGCQSLEGSGKVAFSCCPFEADRSFQEANPGVSSTQFVKISVSDNGKGIHPDVIDSIFEPFFTTKGIGRGSGLGLAIVYGIVRANGGVITVDSRVGCGTRFDVYLPAASLPLQDDLHPRAVNVPSLGAQEMIVVVDDEEALLGTTLAVLKRLNYAVHGFTNPGAALAFVENHKQEVELILSDLTMPDMTGIELAEKVHEFRKDLPIILTSGFNHGLDESAIKGFGVVDFLQKPVSSETLGDHICKILHNSAEHHLENYETRTVG